MDNDETGHGRHGRLWPWARAARSIRPCGRPSRGAEQTLAASHLAGVGFVVVAGEMKQAVKDEDLDFCGERVALGSAAWRRAVGTLMARSPAMLQRPQGWLGRRETRARRWLCSCRGSGG
jgi:hypothetical protein